jgi:hypothetical protein
MRGAAMVGLVLALAACGGSSSPEFRQMPGQSVYAMIVPKGADPATLPALAKGQCGTAPQCNVYGWPEGAAAAALPMTDQEAAALLFSYSLNRSTGYEQAVWNCRVYPRRDRAECMAS